MNVCGRGVSSGFQIQVTKYELFRIVNSLLRVKIQTKTANAFITYHRRRKDRLCSRRVPDYDKPPSADGLREPALAEEELEMNDKEENLA